MRYAVLAATLLLSQPAPGLALVQPPATTAPVAPAVPPAVDAGKLPWLELALRARLTEEFTVLLTDLNWSEEDRNWFISKVIPAYCNSYIAVPIADEAARRIAPYRPKRGTSTVMNPETVKAEAAKPYAAYSIIDEFVAVADVRADGFDGLVGNSKLPPILKPGLIRLRQMLRQSWHNHDKDEAAQAIVDEIAAAAAVPGLQGENVRLIVWMLDTIDDDSADGDIILKAAENYATRPDADPWLASYFTGAANVIRGWEKRGAGYVNETSNAEFKAFHRHLSAATDAFVKASELKPRWPEPASHMIIVAMASPSPAAGTPLEWYQAAIKADPECISAAKRLSHAAMPRWGGRFDWSKLVLNAAKNGNYHGAMPQTALTAFLDATDDRVNNVETVLAEPGVYETLTHVLNTYLKTPNPGMSPDLARSWLMLLAYHANKPQEAAAALATPGFTPRPTFTVADANSTSIRWWAAVASSPHSKRFGEAERLARAGKLDKALPLFTALAAESPTGDTATLIASRALLCARLEKALGGEAASLAQLEQVGGLPAQSALQAWILRSGDNLRIDRRGEREALAFGPLLHKSPRAQAYLPVPMEQFKSGYELSFDLEFTAPPVGVDLYNDLIIWFNNRGPEEADASDEQALGPRVVITPRRVNFSEAHSERERPKQVGMLPRVAKHSIRLLVSGWVAELYCDGELIDWCVGASQRDEGNKPGQWLSIVGSSAPGGEARVENLTIKGLTERLTPRKKRDRDVPPRAPQSKRPSSGE